MRGLWLEADQLTYRTDLPDPQPGPDEALLEVRLAGICGTDLALAAGYTGGYRGLPGHELVATVADAPVPGWTGRRVVAEINVPPAGHTNDPRHAPGRQVLGLRGRPGAFAERLAVPLANLHPVPDALPDQAAVFCEPLAAALRLREQGLARPTDQAAVLGPGRLGLLIAQTLALDGAAVSVLGRRRESLALPARLGLATGLAAEAAPDTFDLVVDATGNPDALPVALRLARPLGTVVLKTTAPSPSPLATELAVVKELKVVGSRCGPFPPALRLLARGAIATEPLLTALYPLADGPQAFAHAAQPGALKVLLHP